MEKDFDYINDEKEQKIIEMLTPKHLEHTMKLKRVPRKNRTVGWLKQLSAIAAMIAIAFFIGAHLLQPDSAYSMPATSKEILTNTIKAIRELSSISMEFDARIQTVTPDHADCSNTGTPAKCRYRYIQDKENVIQRIDFDFDSIKICNIYVNDTVFMWKDKELLYKGIKESPTGLKGLTKIENILEKFSDYKDIKLEEKENITTLKHEAFIEGGTLVTEGEFDSRTGLLDYCRVFFVHGGYSFPIVESKKMEYNIPITKEEMLNIQ